MGRMHNTQEEKYYIPTLGQAVWLRGSEKMVSIETVCALPFRRRLAQEALQMKDDVHYFGKAWRKAYKALCRLAEKPKSKWAGNPLLLQALEGLTRVDRRWCGVQPDELVGRLEFVYVGLVVLHVEESRPSKDFLLRYYRLAADAYWGEAAKLAA